MIPAISTRIYWLGIREWPSFLIEEHIELIEKLISQFLSIRPDDVVVQTHLSSVDETDAGG